MSEFSYFTEEVAAHQIAERVDDARRTHLTDDPRPHGRHALAARLHRLANRIDG